MLTVDGAQDGSSDASPRAQILGFGLWEWSKTLRTATLQTFPPPVGLLFGKFYDVAPIVYAHTWLIQNTDTEQIILELGFSIAIYHGISWYVYSLSAPATKVR